jgi:hypothetical protein
MLYNQPFDKPPEVIYGDTPYINGNPATGQPGSIPSAASIEYPQREIVNVIRAAGIGLTPTNSDLTQLLHSLKKIDVFNVFKSAVNAGTASAWIANVPSIIDTLAAGVAFWFKPTFAAVGITTLAFNGVTNQVVRNDGSQIIQGLFPATAWLLMLFDGTVWQIIAGATGGTGLGGSTLTAPQFFYVNGTTGNDTTFDGTSATVVAGTPHGPYATIQMALNQVPKYNLNGYSITIFVAAGTYARGQLTPVNGAGSIFVTGDKVTPSNVQVNGVNSSAFLGSGTVGQWQIEGFSVSASGSAPGDPIAGVCCAGGAQKILIGNMIFRACGQAHIWVADGGVVVNVASCGWTVTGGAGSFMGTQTAGSQIVANPSGSPSLTIANAVTYTNCFVNSASLGLISMAFTSITGAANVTGTKYLATLNGVIYSFGNGVNYYPGTVGGSLSNGGQYA